MFHPPILILDDDPDVGTAARLLLRRHFGEVVVLSQPERVLSEIEQCKPALLLLDMNFSAGRADGAEGLALLQQIRQLSEPPMVIVMTAYADIALAVRAMQLGAVDFVSKPWDNAKLVATVAANLARRQSSTTQIDMGLLGDSALMRELRGVIAQVGPTEANVLILGENGVGKELVARAIHAASRRFDQTCLAVDMGALPETTFESELFGHKKGSFTDAKGERLGRFQAARGGTLFLDEIGNLPLALQAKLLTVLERREITPLGADRAEPVDVRIISATNLDESRLFDPQLFRPDLLYRLNTIVLRVPPLRARREDILSLVDHYLTHYARHYGKPRRALSASAKEALLAYSWPGNVRDLRHACERASILAQGEQLLSGDFGMGASPVAERTAPQGLSPITLHAQERQAVSSAMAQAQGNISAAAKLLGLSRAALYRKLDKHGL